MLKANRSTFSGKKVYVLCNSGQRGARAATALLADNGVDKNTIYTITGGAGDEGDETVKGAFVTVDGYKFVSGTDAIAAAKTEVHTLLMYVLQKHRQRQVL